MTLSAASIVDPWGRVTDQYCIGHGDPKVDLRLPGHPHDARQPPWRTVKAM
jgi:hypothetical protein